MSDIKERAKENFSDKTGFYYTDEDKLTIGLMISFATQERERLLDELMKVKLSDICCYPANDNEFADGVEITIDHYRELLKSYKSNKP